MLFFRADTLLQGGALPDWGEADYAPSLPSSSDGEYDDLEAVHSLHLPSLALAVTANADEDSCCNSDSVDPDPRGLPEGGGGGKYFFY